MGQDPLESRLAAGDAVFGTMVFEFDSPGLARIGAAAGQIAHANGAGLVPIVNPPSAAREFIGRPHLGAEGLMIVLPATPSLAPSQPVIVPIPVS